MDLPFLNPKIQQFIQEQIGKSVAKLALQKNPFPNVDWISILNQIDAKTKAIMSQPKMLELKKLEIEQIWAEKGVSPYGTNNVFGANTTVLKGLTN